MNVTNLKTIEIPKTELVDLSAFRAMLGEVMIAKRGLIRSTQARSFIVHTAMR